MIILSLIVVKWPITTRWSSPISIIERSDKRTMKVPGLIGVEFEVG